MSESAVQKNFHTFCKHFAEDLFKEYVVLPEGAGMTKVRKEYHDLGFTVAVGSTDVTHVAWDCCPHSQFNFFTGQEGRPTIAYQATVTHSRYVVGVTQGYPGAQNDKTIVRNDLTVSTVREKKGFKEMEYKLKNVNGEDELCSGAYLIVYGGHHKWRCLVNPTKHCLHLDELAFSKRLESVRKDVECFLGFLKGRFRILKLPVLYHTKERIDNMFFTRCILHNMLNICDGMDVLEKDIDWAGEDGCKGIDPEKDVSGIGSGASAETVEVENGHAALRERLVTSFTYRSNIGNTHWLKKKTAREADVRGCL